MKKTLMAIYSRPKLAISLRFASHIAGIYAFVLFAFVFAKTVSVSWVSAVKFALIIGLSYIVVSIARRIINAPRPYELYDFYKVAPKHKCGVSFPSRHTFLVFAIATVCFPVTIFPSVILYILSIILAVSRVLLGIHFIRDVSAGALLGVLSSVVGLWIFSPF